MPEKNGDMSKTKDIKRKTKPSSPFVNNEGNSNWV